MVLITGLSVRQDQISTLTACGIRVYTAEEVFQLAQAKEVLGSLDIIAGCDVCTKAALKQSLSSQQVSGIEVIDEYQPLTTRIDYMSKVFKPSVIVVPSAQYNPEMSPFESLEVCVTDVRWRKLFRIMDDSGLYKLSLFDSKTDDLRMHLYPAEKRPNLVMLCSFNSLTAVQQYVFRVGLGSYVLFLNDPAN